MTPVKKVLIALAALCGFLLIVILLFLLTTAPKIQPLDELHLASISDGTYIGSCDNRIVKVTVEVTVKNHHLTGVTILRHDNGMGKKAEAITAKVLEAQSLDVDAISGATYSSNTILKAIQNALEVTA